MKHPPPRQRVQVLLPADLHARLVKTCAASDVTLTDYIAEAIRDHLEGTGDRTVLFRRLDRTSAAQEQTGDDVELLLDAFGHFVQFWFAHTPALQDTAKATARDEANARYKKFVEHVHARRTAGHLVADHFRTGTVPLPTKPPELASPSEPKPKK